MCVKTSPVTIMSTVSSNGCLLNGVSTCLTASSGSASALAMAACTVTHAPTGSSLTDGTAANSTPTGAKTPGIQSVR